MNEYHFTVKHRCAPTMMITNRVRHGIINIEPVFKLYCDLIR